MTQCFYALKNFLFQIYKGDITLFSTKINGINLSHIYRLIIHDKNILSALVVVALYNNIFEYTRRKKKFIVSTMNIIFLSIFSLRIFKQNTSQF